MKPRVHLQWSQYPGETEGSLRKATLIEFRGCALTAYGGPDGMGEDVWLYVDCWAEYLRDVSGLCAFCHGDPCGESSAPDSLIRREMAAHPPYAPFETCPCCLGRPA